MENATGSLRSDHRRSRDQRPDPLLIGWCRRGLNQVRKDARESISRLDPQRDDRVWKFCSPLRTQVLTRLRTTSL
jgi:hypothetical protein